MRRIPALTLGLALALLGASCGDDTTSTSADPSPTTGAPTTTSTARADDVVTSVADDDPIVGCPSGPTFPLSALDDVAPIADAPAGVETAMSTFLDSEEGAFWPQDGWRLLHRTTDRVLAVHVGDRSTAATSGLTFVTLEGGNGTWELVGASRVGDCPLQFQLAEGLGVVEWELDPADPVPGPDATAVRVLATERACASAQPMGNRLNEPVVLADDSQISITFSVVPLEGDQDCPGNPPVSVVVELGEALGERRLVDGREVGVELEDLLPPAG